MNRESSNQLDVAYVARLARLRLTAEEASTLQSQLGQVLEHVRKLEAIDVTGVEPTAYSLDLHEGLRADKVSNGISHEDALHNAPASADGLFSVPPIIE